MVTVTRPLARRPGPSVTSIATDAVGEGWVPTARVSRHPDLLTVSPLPCSTDAAVIEHAGAARASRGSP